MFIWDTEINGQLAPSHMTVQKTRKILRCWWIADCHPLDYSPQKMKIRQKNVGVRSFPQGVSCAEDRIASIMCTKMSHAIKIFRVPLM